jgi:cyclophilin family peptidyl-prolyl cis-trans isomerase/HEAT repeat protein
MMFTLSLCFAMVMLASPATTPPEYWNQLVEARVSRDTRKLDAEQWSLAKKSPLAMQEYLLTLGQVGNPADAVRVASFFKTPRLSHAALLAYGEIDGAPVEPLMEAWADLDADGKNLAFESICKLGDTSHSDQAYKMMADLKDFQTGLFHFWRLRTEKSDENIFAITSVAMDPSPGIAYYFYRGRVMVGPDYVIKLIKLNKEDAQALIYTLRIPIYKEADTTKLAAILEDLTGHRDWRIRVNALNALASIDQQAALRIAMNARFATNPNVVANAMAMLGRDASEEQHKLVVQQAEAVDQASFLNAARSASKEVFQTHYQSLINTWKHSDQRWRRSHWVRLARHMEGPRIRDSLRELALGADHGIASLAIQSLAAGEFTNWPEVAKEVWASVSKTPDPMLMGDVAGSVRQKDGALAPIGLDNLKAAAAKAYADPKFHYDLINNLSRQLSPEALEPLLNAWSQHPDYLVRLKAINTLAEDKADRSNIFSSPWQHELPKPLLKQASANFNTREKIFWKIKTSKGMVEIQLQPNYAPLTVANMMHLSQQGFFNNHPIHRVVPNFVVQAGDVRGDGMGGPEHIIPCEINALRYQRGAVGMALSGKDTGGSQFFICHSAQPHLDGGYTVFGYVAKGMDIVDLLAEGDMIEETTIYKK